MLENIFFFAVLVTPLRVYKLQAIVFVLYGNLEIGAHVWVQSLLYGLFKAFDKIERSIKSTFILSGVTFFPSCVRNMFRITI